MQVLRNNLFLVVLCYIHSYIHRRLSDLHAQQQLVSARVLNYIISCFQFFSACYFAPYEVEIKQWKNML